MESNVSAKVITVIPARAGSERFPGKNNALLGGKTLIARAIEIGLELDMGPVVVTSDDPYALGTARRMGATPLPRPPHLCERLTPSIDVWRHAVECTESVADLTVLLEPTCPLRLIDDVLSCIYYAELEGAACTVSQVRTPPEKYLVPDERGMVALSPVTATQAFPTPYMYRNGAAYAAQVGRLGDDPIIAKAVLVHRPLVSVDTPFDLELCKLFEKYI